jgi:two-component system response regulator MprA
MGGRRARVLVVDDDEMIRDLLGYALEDAGYDVRLAADGREALDALAAWHADAIVLDLMMPRLDGWGFCAEQRRRPAIADIPVIVLSAVRDLNARTADLAAAAVLAKPFELDALFAALQAAVSPAEPPG